MEVKLVWSLSSNAGSYRVVRGTVSGSFPTVIGTTSGNEITDDTVLSGMTYYYQVLAENGTGSRFAVTAGSITTTGGFNPDSISGLILWLDAQDRQTLTLSGSSVTDWRDKSPNSAVATGTPPNQPSYSSAYINGNPALTQSGSQYLVLTPAISFSDSTVFSVQQHSDLLGVQNNILGGTSRGMTIVSSAGDSAIEVYDGTTYSDFTLTSPLTVGVPTVFTSIIPSDSGSTKFYVNNVNQPKTGGIPGSFSFVGDLIGARTRMLWHLQGGYGEILVYNRVLSSPEIQQVYQYLSTRWGIS